MLENWLRVGEIYETIIAGKNIGKTLYIGKVNSKSVKYFHTVVFKGKDKTKCWRFNDYSIEFGGLKIKDGVEKRLSETKREFIDERLKRSNL